MKTHGTGAISCGRECPFSMLPFGGRFPFAVVAIGLDFRCQFGCSVHGWTI
jgi:hypothetical protein